MRLKIEINCENDVFCDDPGKEIARILQQYIEFGVFCHRILTIFPLYDINGNKVGSVTWEENPQNSL